MKFEKFLKRGFATLAVCGVFFVGAVKSDAETFTVIECVNKGEPFKIGVSQKEMASRGVPVSVVGEFANDDPSKPTRDLGAMADACWAAWAHFVQPNALLNTNFMTEDSKKKMADALDKMGESGLQARAKKKIKPSGRLDRLTFPQPFDNFLPNFYLIIRGEPVYKRDSTGKITGVDAEKTRFVGRPEDHAMIALNWDLGAYDTQGKSAGQAIGYMPDIAPGYLLYSLVLGRTRPFTTNAQGEEDFTGKEMSILQRYWGDRVGVDAPPQEIVNNLYKRKAWAPAHDTGNTGDAWQNRAQNVLENPVSSKPIFLTPELNKSLAKLESGSLAQDSNKNWKAGITSRQKQRS
jgi:hypothetical protein